LRTFKAKGGKLIILQGWDDSGSPLPLANIDYYETLQRTMGGPADTQSFARLFMVPGLAHCGGGPGANAFDHLGYLEAWVEGAHAPDVMIGAHIEDGAPDDYLELPQDSSRSKFTRPVYPYPLQARYKGVGDPNDAANFGPVSAR
jgi:feruloyl esterase